MSPWYYGLGSGEMGRHLLTGPPFRRRAGKPGIRSSRGRFGPKHLTSDPIVLNQGWQNMAYDPNLGSCLLVNKVFWNIAMLSFFFFQPLLDQLHPTPLPHISGWALSNCKWCWQEVQAAGGLVAVPVPQGESLRQVCLKAYGETCGQECPNRPERDSDLVSASHTIAPSSDGTSSCSHIHGGAQHSEDPGNGRHRT